MSKFFVSNSGDAGVVFFKPNVASLDLDERYGAAVFDDDVGFESVRFPVSAKNCDSCLLKVMKGHTLSPSTS